ncbi:hypothetical protein SAMN04487941_2116 [Pontibacter akesuensis]|uniref:Tissue inhibitor of metalloproteinase n=2 Tax=Pontibacter akesuensis TaxID=388950 RepID=A0A1I7IDA2_9BACT|nr:hypothetical protein SAMN04487941_2116 [Pontibacter akesuensis]
MLLVSLKSFACDCELPSSDIEEHWKRADQIFIGEVIESTSDKLYTASGLNFTYQTIRVAESLKGHFHPKFRLRTFEIPSPGSCELYFEVGKKYLIYANESYPILSAHLCSRTSSLEEVEESEIEALRRLTKYYGEEKRPTVVIEKTEAEQELEIARARIEELNNTKKWLFGTSLALVLLLLLSVFTGLRRKKDEVQHGT